MTLQYRGPYVFGLANIGSCLVRSSESPRTGLSRHTFATIFILGHLISRMSNQRLPAFAGALASVASVMSAPTPALRADSGGGGGGGRRLKRCGVTIYVAGSLLRCVVGQGRSEQGSEICRGRKTGTACGCRGNPVALTSLLESFLTHTSLGDYRKAFYSWDIPISQLNNKLRSVVVSK